MFSQKKDLVNVLSILVFCHHDSTFLLLLREDRGDYWIPSTKMTEKYSWKDNLQMFKKRLFDYEIFNEKLIKIYKIWTVEKEYFHLIFLVTLPKEVKTNCKSNTPLGKVRWCTYAQIIKLKLRLRSLEILEALKNYIIKPQKNTEKVHGEIVPLGILTEVRESDIIVYHSNCYTQSYCNLLESAGMPIEEQYNLYENYFMHTYPCIYMNPVSFKNSISQFYSGSNVPELFRAADVWKRGFLTFHDFLYLIAVMAPNTPHYGNLAEIRCQYIFRYYDESIVGKMNYNNFQKMMLDIQYEKSPEVSKAKMDKKVEHIAKSIDFKSNSTMSFDEFFNFVLQSKIGDTSLLLRLEPMSYEKILPTLKHDLSQKEFLTAKISLSSFVFKEQEGSGEDYKVALKTTFLKPGDCSLQMKELKLLAGMRYIHPPIYTVDTLVGKSYKLKPCKTRYRIHAK